MNTNQLCAQRASTCQTEPPSESILTKRYLELDEALGCLLKDADELRLRLEPVLTPPTPESGQGVGECRAIRHQGYIANSFDQASEKVSSVISILADINYRLEV